MTPSQGSDAEVLAADRPAELDHRARRSSSRRRRRSRATCRRRRLAPGASAARRRAYSPANARSSPSSSSSGRIDARKPTRAEVDADHRRARCRASAAARAASSRRRRGRRRGRRSEVAVRRTVVLRRLVLRIDELDAALRATARGVRAPRRSPPAWPCVTTAAVRTGSADGVVDPVVELIVAARGLRGGRGGGRTHGFPSGRAGPSLRRRAAAPPTPRAASATSREHAPVDVRVADHAAPADLRAAGLELRLDEDERLPARAARAASAGGSAMRTRDERDVAGDELGRERQLGQLAGVRALEHGHARVVAQPRVELARSRRRARSRAPRRAGAGRR